MSIRQSLLFAGALLSFAFSLFGAEQYYLYPSTEQRHPKRKVASYQVVKRSPQSDRLMLVCFDEEGQIMKKYTYHRFVRRVEVRKEDCTTYLELDRLKQTVDNEFPFDLTEAVEIIPEKDTPPKKKGCCCVIQ